MKLKQIQLRATKNTPNLNDGMGFKNQLYQYQWHKKILLVCGGNEESRTGRPGDCIYAIRR